MTIYDAQIASTYLIDKINLTDQDMLNFLFTLGCYEEGKITLINRKSNNVIIALKGARYNIDKKLANSIVVKEIKK